MALKALRSPTHPIWGLGRLGVLLVSLTSILWFNASSFDSNELFTIIMVMAGAATAEGVSGLAGKAKSHPVWGFLRLVIVMLSLIITLWMTASNFDKTELNSIIGLFLAAAGAESIAGIFQKETPAKPVIDNESK